MNFSTDNLSPKIDSHCLDELGPLYHEYSFFEVENAQLPGIFAVNQRCKAPTITNYISKAIALAKETSQTISFAELFCADGYYAMVARKLGAAECLGIDNDREGHFHNATKIAAKLNLSNINFIKEEANNIHLLPRVDIVANLGGLYHVTNPAEVLLKSYQMAKQFLIIQTVFSLKETSVDYFETPAPGWTWGCRFSLQWLEDQIAKSGWKVLEQYVNELEANERPEDRGSAYFLIAK